MLKDPMNLLMLILFPIGMVAIMTLVANNNVEGYDHIVNGFNRFATGNLTFNAVFFQFFCGLLVTDILYLEFRTDMRWRLMAAPKPFSRFVISAIIASIFVSIVNGIVVLAFGRFVFDAHLHNLLITSATLLTMGTFVTLVGVLCFMIFPKKGTTTAVMMAFAFAQMLPLQFGMISMERGTIGISNFIPVMTGVNAMQYSGQLLFDFVDGMPVHLETDMRMALIHLGILAGYTLILGIAVAIIGRKRKI